MEGLIIIGFVSAIFGGISMLTGSCFYGCRRSRCTSIECMGCVRCDRSIMSREDLISDLKP